MKNILLGLTVFMVFLSSCTKDFEDYNTDKKNPKEVEGEYLFSNAQKALVDQISSTNVNRNVWKLFAQHWTETTYTDEANYDIVNRTIADNTFDAYYRTILKPFLEARVLIEADPILLPDETEEMKTNKLAIIDLLVSYSYFNLVTMFGDVPYSEALDIENINPKYDDDVEICKSLITKINEANDDLNDGHGSFGSADLYYGGNVAAWKKFAMSLKLKIAVGLADANKPGITSGAWAENAVSNGVFTSKGDDALLQYLGTSPNTNPLYVDLVQSGRSDFVPANTIVDLMNTLADPRMDEYFEHKIDGEWLGGDYGESNSFSKHSHINSEISNARHPGVLMTYDEIQFYIAEAAARGFDVGQTAEEAYNAAIAASFDFWKIPDSLTNYMGNENVAYTTAPGDWRQKIGTQAYIAFYTRGYLGYTEYRRLDFPTMNVSPDALTPNGVVPTRFTYPVNEQTLNADNYSAAVSIMEGNDDLISRLFWDAN